MRVRPTNNNRYQTDIGAVATESESFEEEEDIEGQQDAMSEVSSDSVGMKMQMPTGYLLGEPKEAGSTISTPKKEEEKTIDVQRMVLMAKNPNVTNEEATEEIHRQRHKNRRQQQVLSRPSNSARNGSTTQMDQETFAAHMISARKADLPTISEMTTDDQSIEPSKSFLESLIERMYPSKKGRSRAISIASHSISSETTRKVSNVNEKPPKEQSSQAGPPNRTCKEQISWLRKTKIGRLVLCLMILFLIVLIVIVAMAASGEKENQPNKSQESVSTMIPRPDLNNPDTSPPTGTISRNPPLPSIAPTFFPTTGSPTQRPSEEPSAAPAPATPSATRTPTSQPSDSPSQQPSYQPTIRPSRSPTATPTKMPTDAPTSTPTSSPTFNFLETPFQQVGGPLPGAQEDERFGHAISLSSDGLIMAVGSPDAKVDGKNQAGMVQVYQWSVTENGWVERGDALTGRNRNDQFGGSVGLSEDGAVLVVSEPTYDGEAGNRSGGVRVFVWGGFDGYLPLGQQLEGEAASDHFGVSVAVSKNGRRLAIGAPYHDNGDLDVSGQVSVYELDAAEGRWMLLGSPIPGSYHLEWFGWNVDMSDDGSIVAAGAPRNLLYGGYVNCYEFVNGDWQQLGETMQNLEEPLRYDDNFGHVVRMNGAGNRIAIGSPGKNNDASDSGLIVVFELDDERQWIQLGNSITSEEPRGNDQLGFSLDLRGDILVAGIPGRQRRGQVDFFQYDSATQTWVLHPDALEGEAGSNFGFSVRLTDTFLAVGSAVTSGDNTGNVRIFSQS